MELKNKVIFINDAKQEDEKPVEFTHELFGEVGYHVTEANPKNFSNVIYLGRCLNDGDMFMVRKGEVLAIYKGHLNSGKY